MAGYDLSGGSYANQLWAQMQRDYAADQIAQQTAQLNRDRFNQIEVPTYQNVTLPGFQWNRAAQGIGLTGYYRNDPGASGGMNWASYGDQGATPTFDTARYYTDMLSRNTGPREYWKYQTMMAGRPGQSLGGMADIFRAQKPWGAVQATPSWEQMAAQYNATGSVAPQGRAEPNTTAASGAVRAGDGGAQTQATTQANGWGIPTDVLQPHKLTAQQLGNMSGTQREMQSGLWSAQGLDPNDMWQRAYRAQPQGQAAKGTTWRGTW